MFISKSKCKKYLIEMSQKHRNGKFTRVGQDVFEHLEFYLKREMEDFVKRHPSIGKTLQTGTRKKNSE